MQYIMYVLFSGLLNQSRLVDSEIKKMTGVHQPTTSQLDGKLMTKQLLLIGEHLQLKLVTGDH